MNKTEKAIYELLKKSVLFRDEKGIYTIFPQKLLIKASGKSERTIRYVLKNLEDQKYIIRIMYQEVNLMKFYFLKEEDLTGLEIIDRSENCPPSSENCSPSSENCPPSSENCSPSSENCPPSFENCSPSSENCPPSSENCPPSFENCSPSFENCSPSSENCSPSSENCPPSLENCTPPPENEPYSKDENIERINTKKIDGVAFPLDKVNSTLWYGFPVGEVKDLKAESDKDSRKGKQASILLLLDFQALNGVNISRELTVYDKWVWNACANLNEQGHKAFTAEQIYQAMGNEGRPNSKTKEKILDSVETLSRARVTIDNTEEHELYPNYDRLKATFPLLDTEICIAYSRGQIVEDAIRIIQSPKLFEFAEDRHQITKLPINVLESPLNKTEDNLLLSDYLLMRISKMRNSKYITRTILLDTIYQKCCIETYKQKQRLPEKIEKILNHYKELEWIKDFQITEREIIIITF